MVAWDAAKMLGMRKPSSAARVKWTRIVAEQRRSGLPVKRFCEARGIPASSVFAWKRKLADAGEAEAAVFVEAKVKGVDDDHRGSVGGIAIELARGRRVLVGRGFDRQLLRDVIETLEAGAGGEA